MWSPLVLCLFVGLAYASTYPAWKDNTEYVYLVNGRTLSSLHEFSDHYSGIFLKAKLYITPCSDGKLQGKIVDPQYAQIQNHLPGGWDSEVPESQISYKQLPFTQKPFQFVLENNLIKQLIVEKEVANWEANIIKSILSQLQLDLQGQNAISSPINNFPSGDRLEGVFKTMEETVTGETETLYEIHRLPEYLVQSQHWLVPQQNLKGDGDIIEVIKSKNFTNAEERPSYHYGFGHIDESEPTSNKMGQFFVRESYSRAILTGKPSRYAIQSSYTVNKIIVNPILNNKEMGSVISMVNVTLFQVNTQQQQPQDLSNPIEIGNLVYTYENPSSKNNQVHEKYLQKPLEDYSSSEESNEETWKRYRRYVRQTISKQSEERSSEEYTQYQLRPQMSRALESPLLPFMMGYHGKSIRQNSDFDVKQNVEKLAQEISQEISDPSKILSESTLNKYTILNSLVRLMNEEEIKSVAEQLYTQEEKGQARLTWVVYRDAVAEAGTGPAFLNIKQWIESKKVQKYEAAEVIATMANAVRTPTEDYMRQFFELIKEPQVKEQEYLNETAVHSYTELVYQVYINRNESHNQYPVHAFGSFYTKEGREFIKSTVIPYLSKQLDDAVLRSDARKTHVYVNALRNIAHRKMLEAFEPYLEGQKQVSQFQRMVMVASMDRFALQNPTVARSVLYKVYQNTAEMPQVRVVAVYLLIKTNPPVEMLQRMAQNTNIDTQEPVNAAVKSVIESACNLKASYSQQLRNAAQAARPLLTRKDYGSDYSYLELRDYIIEQMGDECYHDFLSVGSQDSNWPNTLGLSVVGNMHGMKQKYITVRGMISSVEELVNVLYRQTEQYQKTLSERTQRQSTDSKWSSPNIAQMMDYQRKEREQLEAAIFAEIEHVQKVWYFDNQTLEHLPEVCREQEELLKNGKQFNYAKLKQLKEMALSFPTEMGLPFLYTYDMPLLVRFEGNIKAVATPQICRDYKWHKPEQVSTEIDGYFTVSAKIQSHLTFVTPFDHQVYMAGYDRNFQTHVPLKGRSDYDVKNSLVKIEYQVEEPHKDSSLLHFSSYPYISRSDIMTIRPVALRPNTYIIKAHLHQHRHFDVVFGKKETGLAFRAWGHHHVQSVNLGELANIWNSEGMMTMWDQLWDKVSLDYSEVNVAFDQSQSTVSKITLRYKYDQAYKKQPEVQKEEDYLTLPQLASKLQSDDPKQRQQEIIKHVGSGISSSHLYSGDISLELEGDKKYQHILGCVYVKSNAYPKSRALIYYKNKVEGKQFAFQAKSDIPNTNGLDLTYSLETEPLAKYDVRYQYGQSEESASKVSCKFELRRSDGRKQYLINQEPLYHVCKEQMQQGNFQLSACQNMTIGANFLDDIKFQLQYDNLNKRFAENIDGIYQGLHMYYYPMTETQSVSSEGDNVVNGRIQFHPENFRRFNVTIRSKDEEIKFFNLSVYNEAIKTILVPHPVFHLPSRIYGVLKGWQQFRPTCTIDQNAAQTFSNNTYPLSLDKKYTVIMQYIPQNARISGQDQWTVQKELQEQWENYVVLARQVSSNEKELIVTFNHPESNGTTVQVEIKPKQGKSSGTNPAGTVSVDGQQMQFSDTEIADLYNGFVQIYALPNGEVKFEIQDAFYLIYDGKRVKLTATSGKLRDSVYGLCGRFSQDKYEDFSVPAACVVRDPQKFVQSYQVENKQQRRQLQSDQQECVRKVLPLYADVISDRDAGRAERYQGQHLQGTKLRHRYIEENDQICFTIRPVPECNGSAGDTVTKYIPVHCIQGTKTAYYLKAQIDKGGNPDFSHKSESKKIRLEIPSQCN